jgi:uridine phosphorylase
MSCIAPHCSSVKRPPFQASTIVKSEMLNLHCGDVTVHEAGTGGKQYYIACGKGDLAEYVLLPGDPDRVAKIVKFWDSAKEVSSHREFRSFTGRYKNAPISVLSTGIGPACMAIAVNEAACVGARTFIRVGSTGAIQKDIAVGDVVISSAAVRLDCTSNCYVMPEYPAAAHYEVLLALIEAAESLGVKAYHVGVTVTTADFYAGQSRVVAGGCLGQDGSLLPLLQRAGVLCFEMETATLYTLASLYGLRAASVCAVFANRCTNEFRAGEGEETAIRVANEAVKILSDWDRLGEKSRKRWLFPSLMRSLR